MWKIAKSSKARNRSLQLQIDLALLTRSLTSMELLHYIEHTFRCLIVRSGLKGNPVKIRNCPAAVSRNERSDQSTGSAMNWEAGASRQPASPKTCRRACPYRAWTHTPPRGRPGVAAVPLCRRVSLSILLRPKGFRLMIQSLSYVPPFSKSSFRPRRITVSCRWPSTLRGGWRGSYEKV